MLLTSRPRPWNCTWARSSRRFIPYLFLSSPFFDSIKVMLFRSTHLRAGGHRRLLTIRSKPNTKVVTKPYLDSGSPGASLPTRGQLEKKKRKKKPSPRFPFLCLLSCVSLSTYTINLLLHRSTQASNLMDQIPLCMKPHQTTPQLAH